jgi:hypothetical protein
MARIGKTKTITISIGHESAKFVEQEAKRRCDGNVSHFFGLLVAEAARLAAMDRVLDSSGHRRLTEEELQALRKEVSSAPSARKRRAA